MRKLIVLALGGLMVASCNDGVKKVEQVALLQRDSLEQIIAQKDNEINDMMTTLSDIEEGFREITEAQIIAQKDNEINDMMTTLSDIEEGFREITEAQNRVTLAKEGEGTNTKLRIKENIQFIQSAMKQNKELINKLKQQVRESSVKGEQLKKIIDNLTEQMQQKDQPA